MLRLAKKYYKDAVVVAALAGAIWFGVQEVRGWYAFRQAQLVNINVIAAYMKNDNPRLLTQLIGGANNAAQDRNAALPSAKKPGSAGAEGTGEKEAIEKEK